MSDTVKLIIEIPKDYYEIIKHDVDNHLTNYRPFEIIANGIPLPKGHGRLIDADKLLDYGTCPNGCDGTTTCMESYEHLHCPIRVFDIESINDTPTIIEAESEEHSDGLSGV